MFSELDEVTPGHAILASNTSSLSITEMARGDEPPRPVVGFHFFYPASVMRLIEVIEGDDTSPETVQAAINFAQAIRKTRDPLRRGAGVRGQPDPQLERVRAVARPGGDRDRRQGDRQDRRPSRRPRRSARSSCATCSGSTPCCTSPSTCATPTAIASSSTGGCGSWSPPASSARRPERASMSTEADLDAAALVDRFTLKALVESCLVLEEGVASMKDIDLGMMAGAGIIPPPFARADQIGLDEVLAQARARRAGVGRGLRAADDPAAAGRPGPARRQDRPGLLPLRAAGRRAGRTAR